MGFPQGINVHTEELLRDSSQIELVKRAGLVLFCWGDDNNDTETIKHLKDLGIHAVIYDKYVPLYLNFCGRPFQTLCNSLNKKVYKMKIHIESMITAVK